jgi:hypothetical protein
VIESVPTGNVLRVRVAVLPSPLPEVNVPLPIAVAPFIKTTDPVGEAYALESVAVSVTGWPALDGFNDDATVAVVLVALTTWLSAAEVDAPKLAVAAYTAVIESGPAAKVEILSVAVLLKPPAALSVALPIDVPPLMNTTEPVGAPYPLETVAVKLTGSPALEGFFDEATAVVVLAALTT